MNLFSVYKLGNILRLPCLQETFEYNSPLWTNNETFNVEAGLDGLTEVQTKLASYYATSFANICLGMKVDYITKWIKLNYTGHSLYSVIADENYHATNLGSSQWMSLMENSKMQTYCNMEGFNMRFAGSNTHVRIGLVANNEIGCNSPDSVIGFGIKIDNWANRLTWSSGNVFFIYSRIPSFGYIFVQ